MTDSIRQWAEEWIRDCGPFRAGFVTAVAVILFLLLLWSLYRIFSRKHVREIIVPCGNGGLCHVSSSAVSDLAKAVIRDRYRNITVKKIILWKTGRGTLMEITASFDINDSCSLPETAEEMKEAILKSLEKRLGITSVKEVIPKIKKITSPGSLK
jgi:hypothetical protein